MLSILMVVFGIIVLVKGRFRFGGGGKEVRGGTAYLVGLILLIPPAIFFCYGFYLGVQAKNEAEVEKHIEELMPYEIGASLGAAALALVISAAAAERPRRKRRDHDDDYDHRPRRSPRYDDDDQDRRRDDDRGRRRDDDRDRHREDDYERRRDDDDRDERPRRPRFDDDYR